MANSPSPRPLSVKVIAVWYLFQAFFMIGNLFVGSLPHTLASEPLITVSSWAIIALDMYLIIGLWLLQEWARKIAIGFSVYNIMSSLYSEVIISVDAVPGEDPISKLASVLAILILCVADTLMIYFLIKRKSAFVKPKPSSQ